MFWGWRRAKQAVTGSRSFASEVREAHWASSGRGLGAQPSENFLKICWWKCYSTIEGAPFQVRPHNFSRGGLDSHKGNALSWIWILPYFFSLFLHIWWVNFQPFSSLPFPRCPFLPSFAIISFLASLSFPRYPFFPRLTIFSFPFLAILSSLSLPSLPFLPWFIQVQYIKICI